jgi:hypothetical protein
MADPEAGIELVDQQIPYSDRELGDRPPGFFRKIISDQRVVCFAIYE